MGKLSVLVVVVLLFVLSVFAAVNLETTTIKIPLGDLYELPKFALIFFSVIAGGFAMLIIFSIRDTKKLIDNWQYQKRQRADIKMQGLYSRALDSILAHREDDARAALEDILVEEPGHIGALLRLGDLYAAEEEYQKANTYYQKARMTSPQNLEALFAVERVMEKTSRWSEALKYIDDILDLDDDNLSAMYRKRGIFEKQGRWDELVYLQKTILKHEHTEKDRRREQQNLVGYEYEYGRDSLEDNQLEKAKKAFKTALRLEKDFVPAVLGLAEAMLREGDSEEAINMLEKSFEASDSLVVMARLEDLLINLGEPARLISIYKASISRRPQDSLLKFCLGKLYYRLEMIDDAFEVLTGVYAGGATYPELHQLLGNMHLRRGQPEKAAQEFKKSVDIKMSLRLPYCCNTCGYGSPEWSGRCPDCMQWGTYHLNLEGVCKG